MDITLQVWGGVCYLLNKVFLSHAEGIKDDKRWRVCAWAVYLAGLPAWVIILILKRDWMAAAIEAGGAPAMILGLVAAIMGLKQTPGLLKKGAGVFAYGLLAVGVAYSLYDFGGITAFSQVLEIGVILGFLAGSYLLAKENAIGWLFFMLMNISMGTLMAIQGKPILVIQQTASLCFVFRGFFRSRRKPDNSRLFDA